MKNLFLISSVAAALLASSCSTYTPDTSLTSQIHSWQKGKGDTQARISLRNATHRATLDPEKAEQHEKDLIFALQKTTDLGKQKFLINELQLIGTEEAVAPISANLLNPELSSHAINALQAIHNAGFDIDDVLNEALIKAPVNIQIELIKALGSLKNGNSLDFIENLMTAKDPTLRFSAIRSVANIAEEDSASKLLAVLSNEKDYNLSKVISWNFLYAQNLAEENSQLAENHALQVLSTIDKNKQVNLYISGLQTLYKIKGADFSDDLINYMNDQNYRLAEAASRLLENSEDKNVNEHIIKAFSKSGEFYQQLALKVLIKRGDSNSSLLVAQALKSKFLGLRLTACRLASEVKESIIVPGLLELLANGSELDQQEASKALLRIPSDKSSAAIRTAYQKSLPEVQVKLMTLLKTKSDKQNADLALKETLSDDKKVSKAAFTTLKNIAEFRQTAQLIIMLKSSKTSTQIRGFQNALVTSSFGKTNEVSKMLLSEISAGASSKTNLAMIQVLSRIGGQAAFSGLIKLFDKGSDSVQKEVVRTLAKWQDVKQFNELLKVASQTQGSSKILITRGISSLVGNSHYPVEKKKSLLEKLMRTADSKEKERIKELLKKLK